MRVLIAGGTGLIGSALAERLADDGNQVTVLSRAADARRSTAPAGVRFERWDGATVQSWGRLVSEVDAIVNLAGEGIADGRWTPQRKERIRSSRVDAGKALVAALEEAGTRPAALVQASAVGFYGPCRDEELTESAPQGHDFLAGVCHDWEASTAMAETLGLRRAVIRTGVVLSRSGGALPKMTLPFRLFAGGPLGSGRQYFPWIHLEDEVAAIRFLLEDDGASGVYNLSAPDPPRNVEFVRQLGRAMGRPSLIPTPAFALRALFGEMSTVLVHGQRAVPARLLAQGFNYRFRAAADALRDLV